MEILGNLPIQAAGDSYPAIVDVFYQRNETPKPVVIFSHGFKGFKDWGHFNYIAHHFAEEGFVFTKFNFSHNGTSFKKPTEFVDLESFAENNFSKELDDLGAVIDWIINFDYIAKNEIDLDKIYLMGHSRGGGISILKANEDDRIKKLITWASVNDFTKGWTEKSLEEWEKDGVMTIENARTKQMMPLNYQIVEDYHNHTERLDIPSAVKNLSIPHLIIHGTGDGSVSFDQAKEMSEWNEKSTLLALDGADHTFGATHPLQSTSLTEDAFKAVEASIEFFRN